MPSSLVKQWLICVLAFILAAYIYQCHIRNYTQKDGWIREITHSSFPMNSRTSINNLAPQTGTTIWPFVNSQTRSLAAGKKSVRRLPDVIIIGCKKCGTGILADFMGAHPNISSKRGEEHFFDLNFKKGLDWYAYRLPVGTQYQKIVEKTPSYFVGSAVPARIRELLPNVNLILILRDPVKRLVSEFYHNRSTNKHAPEKNRSLVSLLRATDGGVNTDYLPVQTGRYDEHVSRWLRYFPADHLLVLNGEDFIVDPQPVLRRVEEFLDIPEYYSRDMFDLEARRGFPCMKNTTYTAECRLSKGHNWLGLPESVTAKLRKYYKPHMRKLSLLIGGVWTWGWDESS